jgi:acetyltransferase
VIRPYPTRYITRWTLRDGPEVTIRPIRPEDEPLIVQFHQGLSDRTVSLRYFHAIKLSERTAHERMIRVCFSDYDRDVALVAEGRRADSGEPFILGIGRLGKIAGTRDAEYAIVVSDAWQNRGLGTQLLRLLVQVARHEQIQRLVASILPENLEMQRMAEKLGFQLERDEEDSTIHASLDLQSRWAEGSAT